MLINSTDDPELEELTHYVADSLVNGFKRVPQEE